MKIGDIVILADDPQPFLITYIGLGGICTLQALGTRLRIQAPSAALTPAVPASVREQGRRFRQSIETKIAEILAARPNTSHPARPGKVLHIDADEDYLRICRQTYTRLSVPHACAAVLEAAQPTEIQALLDAHRPDILVLTGHDSLTNQEDYQSSAHFAAAIRRARRYQPSTDGLAIIAGACQSHFELLMESGANAASSPGRIRIHALDPLLLAEKLAYTPITEHLEPRALIQSAISGPRGIGALQTRGALRLCLP